MWGCCFREQEERTRVKQGRKNVSVSWPLLWVTGAHPRGLYRRPHQMHLKDVSAWGMKEKEFIDWFLSLLV
jgi:hypothetical protein